MSPTDWPDPDALSALVRRLADDPVAHADFASAVYHPLSNDLRRAFPAEDPSRIADVVGDLVLSFLKRPTQYDPARLPVRNYLLMAARGDLANARAKAGRCRAHEIPLDAVAEPAADGNGQSEDDARAWLTDPRVAAVIAGLDPVERAVWELMLDGQCSTATCAGVLGVGDRPTAEQEREVKRVKDRIVKRLKRAAGAGT